MSRWKSPQAAVKQAERAAKEAAQLRKEKRKTRVMLIGFAFVSISLVIADYLWLKAQAQKRREEHRQRWHQQAQTNSPAMPVTIPQPPRDNATTNHE